MKRLPILLVILLVALWAGAEIIALLRNDNGYVLISYGQTSIEMSLFVAILLIVLGSALFYGLLWLAVKIFSSRGTLSSWLESRNNKRTRLQTTQGLIDFTEGNWTQAKKHLIQAAPKSDTPLINYLMAARASSKLGDFTGAEQYLRQADQIRGATVAVGVTQARLQLENGRFEQCLATLMRLKDKAPRNKVVMSMLKTVYIELKDWKKLENLLPELRKNKVFETPELENLEQLVFRSLLSTIIQKATRSTEKPADELTALWRRAPAHVTKNVKLVGLYADALIACELDYEAESIIRTTLSKQWSDSLIHKYGCARGRDLPKQLSSAEKWLQERPNNAALLLALGRICLSNQNWLKAREYFENSLRLSRTAEVLNELGRLLAQMDEHKKSAEYFSQGLVLGATHKLPNLPLPKHQPQIEPVV